MFVCVVFPFILDVRIMVDPEVEFCVLKRATLMGTKSLYENGANPFFFGFLNLMGTRMIQIRIGKSVRAFRNKITNGFGAQIRLHQRYKTANGFHTRCNYYYIWPMTLLEHKYIITPARNTAAIAKGMVELRFLVFTQEKRENAGGKVRGAGDARS